MTGPDAVALVDTESSYGETRPVLDVVASCLQQYGIDAFSCHLGDLVVEGDVVIAHGRRVGLVHRYFTLSELTGTGSEAQAGRDVLRGLAASGTPVVSPLSTSCFGNKRSLALLWSSEVRSSMTPDEIDVVERLVPWLAPLDARPGEIHDAPDDILAFCLAQRDGLVLKPAFGVGGKGVVIGSEVTDEQWRDLVLGVDPSRYVVQRAIVAMPEALPKDALGATSSWRVNYGVFHIGHSFGGGFVRAAPADGSRVIAEHSGARMGCLFVGGPCV
ncbi:hypothetical protein [Oerskovia enterophila]|uniref:hypothetical protein n=1 Tax=Oerskovia enterophila TaxID=43678 RepID=UPI0011126356|nr:hypothetical protein [Oerskovia enterophila]